MTINLLFLSDSIDMRYSSKNGNTVNQPLINILEDDGSKSKSYNNKSIQILQTSSEGQAMNLNKCS